MALQTSGPISLNDIHVEAGGSSGTNCTINDADIRGLINKGSGATMSFNEWYGASAAVSVTVTSWFYSPNQYFAYWGFHTDASGGGISPTSFTDSNGTTRTFVYAAALNADKITLKVSGTTNTTGFSSLVITVPAGQTGAGDYTFLRTNATINVDTSNNGVQYTWDDNSSNAIRFWMDSDNQQTTWKINL